MRNKIKKPSYILFFTETLRSALEWITSFWFRRMFTPKQQGNGQPVLAIPGFLSSDVNMGSMRRFLSRLNYTPYKWSRGINTGKKEDIPFLEQRLGSIYEKHQQKVDIIGWSLGGIYARELAKKHPHLVNQVITVGSPFMGIDKPNNATRFFNLLNGKRRSEEDINWINTIAEPTPVKTTSLYSKKDGIVQWQYCLDPIEDQQRKNFEVNCSHIGMPHHKSVLKVIAEVLV